MSLETKMRSEKMLQTAYQRPSVARTLLPAICLRATAHRIYVIKRPTQPLRANGTVQGTWNLSK